MTAMPGSTTTGVSVADLLLGLPDHRERLVDVSCRQL
jgi:hypothetical protein